MKKYLIISHIVFVIIILGLIVAVDIQSTLAKTYLNLANSIPTLVEEAFKEGYNRGSANQ